MSKRFQLNTVDLKKIWRGLVIAVGGALVVYLADVVNVLDVSEMGIWGPIVVAGASALVNALRKLLQQY